jgi:hypothetical protein
VQRGWARGAGGMRRGGRDSLLEIPRRHLPDRASKGEGADERSAFTRADVHHLSKQQNDSSRRLVCGGFPGSADECAYAGAHQGSPLQRAPTDILIPHQCQPAPLTNGSQPRFIRRPSQPIVVGSADIRARLPHRVG